MSVTNFLHGIRTLEYDDGTKEINTVDISVIGIVGTAPDFQLPNLCDHYYGDQSSQTILLSFRLSCQGPTETTGLLKLLIWELTGM